jgi:hypothetical protein
MALGRLESPRVCWLSGSRRWLGGNAPENHNSRLLDCFQTFAQEISVSMPELDYVVLVVMLCRRSKGGLCRVSAMRHTT